MIGYAFCEDETQVAPPKQDGVAGRKDDAGKPDPTLLFDDLPNALYGVIEVLQWAVEKKKPVPYERGSWQDVKDFQRRYRAAILRHQLNSAKCVLLGGQSFDTVTDAETGLLELQHIATDALFLLEKAMRQKNSQK